MQRVAIAIGAVLFAMGIVFYALGEAGHRSLTSFIPSLIGLVFVVCGILAQSEVRRKMAMHVAAGVAALGVLGSLMRVLPALTGAPIKNALAFNANVLNLLLCGVFLVLCIRSFSAARANRSS